MDKQTYTPPVTTLLELGEPGRSPKWLDYSNDGLKSEHIPQLIAMAQDEELNYADSDSKEVWAPLHAWRALGQLRAGEAIKPLLSLLAEDDLNDWTSDEIPIVLSMIGPDAIEPTRQFLADSNHGLYARIDAAHTFEYIARDHPEYRDTCVSILTQQLEEFEGQSPNLNAFLISWLVNLNATEAADVMGVAFAADQVDLSVQGDWEEVQISLGLLKERITPKPQYGWLSDEMIAIRQRLYGSEEESSETVSSQPGPTVSIELRPNAEEKAEKQRAHRRKTRKLTKQTKQKQARKKPKKRKRKK